MNNVELMFVEDLAKMLKVKPNTIHSRNWRKRSGCPCIKKGKRLMFVKDDIYRWLKSSN